MTDEEEREENELIHFYQDRELKFEEEIAELKKEMSVLLSCSNCPENKGGYICEKEYNDKCLAQKIEYIKELNEEIAELRGKLEKVSEWVKEQEYPDGCIDCSCSDTEKLKEILK